MAEQSGHAEIIDFPSSWRAQTPEQAEIALPPEANQELLVTLFGDMADLLDMPPAGKRRPRVEVWHTTGEDIIHYEVSQTRINGTEFVERVAFVDLLWVVDRIVPARYDIVMYRGQRVYDHASDTWLRHHREPLALENQVLTNKIAQDHMAEAVAESDRRARAQRRRFVYIGGEAVRQAVQEE